MAAMDTALRGDPRDIITPEAFRVADHLIGVPLARPSRRLWAMLVDLQLVAVLVFLLDAIGLLIALAGAFLVFRLTRGATGRWYQRFFRRGLGCFGALLVFSGTLVVWERFAERGDDAGLQATIETDSGVAGLDFLAGARTVSDAMALRSATTDAERDVIATRLVERLAAAGAAPATLRNALREFAEDEAMSPPAIAALEAAVETTTARLENRAPRAIARHRGEAGVALAAGDPAADPSVVVGDSAPGLDPAPAPDPTLVAARDSIAALAARLEATDAELAAERRELESAQARLDAGTFRWIMSSIADELGLGLGWLGLYFTAFTVLGGGRTPGKRLLRLRVIRLDGEPIGWWTSLQRFGGYSASVFTGLLGFAEMFWDDNRQALQDKLVHTVVIQEPRRPAAEDAGLERASPRPEAEAALANPPGAAAPSAHAPEPGRAQPERAQPEGAEAERTAPTGASAGVAADEDPQDDSAARSRVEGEGG